MLQEVKRLRAYLYIINIKPFKRNITKQLDDGLFPK